MQGHINTRLSLASLLPITPDGQVALGAHSSHSAHQLMSFTLLKEVMTYLSCHIAGCPIPCLFFPIPKLPSPPVCCQDSTFLILHQQITPTLLHFAHLHKHKRKTSPTTRYYCFQFCAHFLPEHYLSLHLYSFQDLISSHTVMPSLTELQLLKAFPANLV